MKGRVILRLLRVKQWIKNFFVFGPLVFSLHLFDPISVKLAGLCFVAFCLVSSSVYIVNDILDVERDRQHPVKRLRPLAAGEVMVTGAAGLAGVLLLAGVGLGAAINPGTLVIISGYAVLNFFYSWRGKHMVLIDIMIVAFDYVLRVLAGAFAINVMASSWLMVATFFLALLLGLAKRYNEIKVLEDESGAHRAVLDLYNPVMLSQWLSIAAAATIVFYALYTLDDQVVNAFGTTNLIFTLPFVVYGVFRYLYLVHGQNEGGDPTELVVRDRPMLANLVLWGATVVLILY